MKRCAQCRGKLGLGVRFRSVALFDSLQALHKLERYDARARRGRTSLRFAHIDAVEQIFGAVEQVRQAGQKRQRSVKG
jgi:hypothetical protein